MNHYCKTVKWERIPDWTLDDMFDELGWVYHLKDLVLEKQAKDEKEREYGSESYIEWKGLNEDIEFLKNAIKEKILKENQNAK